ncbi:hypothetical protein AB4Z42_06930 [Mycobacterium sp. 2YAF39]
MTPTQANTELAMPAVEDLGNRTNMRMPLVKEIADQLRLGYYGAE